MNITAAECILYSNTFSLNRIGPGTFYSFTPTYCYNNCSANACPEDSSCMAGVCVWSRYEELWKAYLATVAEDGGALLPGLPTLVPMGSGDVQGSHPTQIHR